MPIYGVNATGRTWPTELEVSRLDAPSQEYLLDPSLPILGTDPKFGSDKVVIGRGRLVGVKGEASISTDVTNAVGGHKSVLTLADGVNVRPLGYAKNNICKDWAQRPGNVMPDINRNMLIAVPYLAAINGINGALKQGDPVTASHSTDPRYKGAICKFVPKGVRLVSGVTNATTGIKNTGCPVGLAAPVLVGGWLADGTWLDNVTAVITIEAGTDVSGGTDNRGFWQVSGPAGGCTVILSYGHEIHMKAGDVWGMESLNDMPGFMKWVETNYGAWMLPPTFQQLEGSVHETALDIAMNAAGYFDIQKSAANVGRIDASQPIKVVVAGTAIKALNPDTGVFEDFSVGDVLPRLVADTGDYTMGRNYSIDPINGRIYLWGIQKDDGSAMDETAWEARIKVNAYTQAFGAEGSYGGNGIFGFGDGTAAHAGTPQSYLKDPITGGASVGVMRVAIL